MRIDVFLDSLQHRVQANAIQGNKVAMQSFLNRLQAEVRSGWLLTLDETEAKVVLCMAQRYLWLRSRYSAARGQPPEQIDDIIDARMREAGL
jgi:hypothetical protein